VPPPFLFYPFPRPAPLYLSPQLFPDINLLESMNYPTSSDDDEGGDTIAYGSLTHSLSRLRQQPQDHWYIFWITYIPVHYDSFAIYRDQLRSRNNTLYTIPIRNLQRRSIALTLHTLPVDYIHSYNTLQLTTHSSRYSSTLLLTLHTLPVDYIHSYNTLQLTTHSSQYSSTLSLTLHTLS